MKNRTGAIYRKEPLAMEKVIQMFLRSERLSPGLNTRRIFEAWDAASGAAAWTLRKYFRDGVLTVTLRSSAARSSLAPRLPLIVHKMNAILDDDPLFDSEDPKVGKVSSIVLR